MVDEKGMLMTGEMIISVLGTKAIETLHADIESFWLSLNKLVVTGSWKHLTHWSLKILCPWRDLVKFPGSLLWRHSTFILKNISKNYIIIPWNIYDLIFHHSTTPFFTTLWIIVSPNEYTTYTQFSTSNIRKSPTFPSSMLPTFYCRFNANAEFKVPAVMASLGVKR